MMKNLLYLSVLALSMAACSTKYTSEISEIDTLIKTLDSARVQFERVDTAMVHGRFRSATANLAQVGSLTDTVSKEEALMLDRYNSYLKAYRKWSPKIEVVREQLEVVPRQLENLSTDLSKNLIEEEKVVQYLDNERRAVVSLKQTITDMEIGLSNIDQASTETEEKVLLLIDRLRNQNIDQN